MKAYVFPGQGAQTLGMGKELFDTNEKARELFLKAEEILGFKITEIMFGEDAEALKQTKVTQPAIFLHSTILVETLEDFTPNMVAGHSLGEISALVAAKALSFEDGLQIVKHRALAMQKACENNPSGMAAVLGLEDNIVEEALENIEGVIVAANYNCPGQLVISGENKAIEKASEVLKEKGAKRVVILPVSGAFHSPLMESAKEELAQVIEKVTFKEPICPVYQNVKADAVTSPEELKQNLLTQLTGAVKWTQTMQKMIADGAEEFIEVGNGKTLQGLVKKIDRSLTTSGIS